MRIGKFLQWELVAGEPIVVHDTRVTPRARVLSLELPFWRYVWNHPESLVIERNGTRETRFIPDVTLFSQLALAAAVFIVPVLFFAGFKGARK